MNAPTEITPKAALSDYLAGERTLLAWTRTGLALMGFGFAAARFGLFLPPTQATQSELAARPYGSSLCFGIALIAVGIFVTFLQGCATFDCSENWIAVGRNTLVLQPGLRRLHSLLH
jgi:uncharacterized membrane protein YidH (DUF202 family)